VLDAGKAGGLRSRACFEIWRDDGHRLLTI